MTTFKDNADRLWTVSVTVDAIKRVRAIAQVDLLEAAGGKLLEQLASDPVTLCDVLYALVKPEADAKSVSSEDFGRALAGDAIDRATDALLEGLVDFFPQPRRRLLAKALEKLRTLQATAVAAAEAKLDSGILEQRLQELIATPAEPLAIPISGEASIASPASSALSPAPSPSAS